MDIKDALLKSLQSKMPRDTDSLKDMNTAATKLKTESEEFDEATGSNISMTYYDYPGYSWLSTQQNSSTDGNVKYNNAFYNYTGGGPKSILRVYLNWATNNTNFAECI